MQSQLTFPLHERENNAESEQQLYTHGAHFSNQCLSVLDALRRGERLTTGKALVKYQIGDLRARIRDLRQAGVKVLDCYVEGTRFKEYYL